MIEKFPITARNKTFTLQSNRPLLRGKGIKHRKPNYKIIVGGMISSGTEKKLLLIAYIAI